MAIVTPTAPDGLPPTAPAWQRIAGYTGGFVLGAVLLVAAYAKALDPVAYATQIQAEGLAIVFSPAVLALIGVGIEVALGLLLVFGVRRLWVLVPAALLVGLFLFLTGRSYWRSAHGTLPADASCGCFGNLVERTPAEAFWQDAGMLVPALALAFLGRRSGRLSRQPQQPWVRTLLATAGTTAAVVFTHQAPRLPLDDLATRLRPGVAVKDLCAGAGADRVCFPGVVPGVESGAHLLLLADLKDPALAGAVAALNGYAQAARGPALLVLSAGTPEETRAFFWKNGPSFEIREAPAPLLRPLYRTLPRAFLVEEGRVTRTWSSLPPLDELGGTERFAVLSR